MKLLLVGAGVDIGVCAGVCARVGAGLSTATLGGGACILEVGVIIVYSDGVLLVSTLGDSVSF